MNSNQEQVCENCGKRIEPSLAHLTVGNGVFIHTATGCSVCEHIATYATPKPTPDPKMEQCEYCGPICYKGAAHNARVEDNAKVEQVAQRPEPAECEHCGAREYSYACICEQVRVETLEKAVQVHNDSAVEAWQLTRKWQKNVFELEQSCRELEKELRVTRRALEMAVRAAGFINDTVETFLEAARKEQNG
jgi:hypothetical protein